MTRVRVTTTVEFIHNDGHATWSHTETHDGGVVGNPTWNVTEVAASLTAVDEATMGVVRSRFGTRRFDYVRQTEPGRAESLGYGAQHVARDLVALATEQRSRMTLTLNGADMVALPGSLPEDVHSDWAVRATAVRAATS